MAREASIAQLLAALEKGRLSCRELVEEGLARCEALDDRGPALRAVITVNPEAGRIAAKKDAEFRRSRRLSGPLHGITVAVKDNYDTTDMPTSAGTLALKNSRPRVESTVTRKLRGAGAILLYKTNLHELAHGGVTVSSLRGQTKNPYDLTRTPGGSSGGTGAAVAAGYAVAGLGSDTLNSIRSPASANSLVGLRPTRGLVSRAGVIPVSETMDAAGPITRCVADAARLLDVMVGYDPFDPSTARSVGNIPATYTAFTGGRLLKGVRIGVPRILFGSGTAHAEVNAAMEKAIALFARLGAKLVEIAAPELDTVRIEAECDVHGWEFKPLLEGYLAGLGTRAPVKNLDELISGGGYHKPSQESFLKSLQSMRAPLEDPEYLVRLARIEPLRGRLHAVMDGLDMLLYPHQKILVMPIGGYAQPERNGVLAAITGFPALTIPAGFSRPSETAPLGVPIGMDLLARPFQEPLLFRAAAAFERAAKVRRPPRL